MRSRAALLLLASLSAAGLLMAQKIKLVQPVATGPANGKAMFAHYCASCHGLDARGDGPAAPALKMPPTDLTSLAAKNRGVFPTASVRRYIKGVDAPPAHGSRDMPVWGDVFKVFQSPTDTAMIDIRVNALTEYVKTLQTR